jgi:predicted TIM-barrel fold metal-dependent hydrolase
MASSQVSSDSSASSVSSRSKTPIIDCDIHHVFKHPSLLLPYLPRKYKEQIELWGLGTGGGPGMPNGGKGGRRVDSFPPEGGPACSDLNFFIQHHVEAYNVRYAVLTGEFLSCTYVADPYYSAALCSAFNDYTIEHWLDKDDRLRGSIYLPIHDVPASVKEIERIGAHPGMVQAYVPSGSSHPYGKRMYHPIYEACSSYGLNFTLHVGGQGSGMNAPATNVGYPSYYIEYRAARTQAFMAHMASFIFEGVFELFPELQVVFIEGGVFWVPPYLWRLDQDWKALREQTPWVKRKPSEYFMTNMHIGSQPIEETPQKGYFDTMLEAMNGKDKLLYCSDYPHWDFDSPTLAFPKLDKDTMRNIMYNNAAKLYKLPLLDAAEV